MTGGRPMAHSDPSQFPLYYPEWQTQYEAALLETDRHVAGLTILVGRFELFRQHFARRGAKPAHHASPFLRPGRPDVDFYDVGKLDQRYARVVGREIIEGDEIAGRFQPLAGSDDAVFGLNRLQN